ncbi:MAG: hypothetical protein Q4B43_04980 [Bacteroidota bacterium]|nr:hypothetical protein [Bacteroidota bacterium]
MELKKFKVDVYYTSFCSYEIVAENEEKAKQEAVERKINKDEIISNLDIWEDGVTIEIISDEEREN